MRNRKEILRLKRHRRILLHIKPTKGRPRLVIRRSLKNVYAQIIDDVNNKVLFSLSTLNKELKPEIPNAGNVKAAQLFGERFAQKAKEKGFGRIVFDRAGYLYHGRIKAFADGLRKGGLDF
jgi:large subunit ribosomal protein L18